MSERPRDDEAVDIEDVDGDLTVPVSRARDAAGGALADEAGESDEAGDADEDATRVVAPGPADDDRTIRISVPRPAERPAARSAALSTGTGAERIREASGEPLDPERRIRPAPGDGTSSADGLVDGLETASRARPGLRPGIPLVYGARDGAVGSARDGAVGSARADAAGSAPGRPGVEPVAAQRIGPAPGPAPVAVRAGRSALPSLARRERRAARATLLGYAAVIVIAVLGLCGVVLLALR